MIPAPSRPHVAMFYGAGASLDVGLGYGKPGADVPDPVRRGLTGIVLLQALRQGLTEAGLPFAPADCPEVAVVEASIESFAPLRVGDRLHTQQRLLNCSPHKKTKLGAGYFLTARNTLYNQREEIVKTMTLVLFFYRV